MIPKESAFHRVFVTGCCILAALLLLLLIYYCFRTVIRRFSLDYFYPWFQTVKVLENGAAEQTALLKLTKKELLAAQEKLYRENVDLASGQTILQKLRAENEQLRMLLALNAPVEYKTVLGEIILRDPVSWNELFTINKGSDDGIQPGDLALTMIQSERGTPVAAVVGKVEAVSNHTASVITLLHPHCTFSVQLIESAGHGLMRGYGSSVNPQISSLPIAAQYAAGEIVMTSGYSIETPPGLLVGTLVRRYDGSVARAVGHLYAEAELQPSADVSKLRFAAILTRGEHKPVPAAELKQK